MSTLTDATGLVPLPGRPPEQSNDVKQQILAALADEHCNQKIFLVGGSSGATHSLWAALDPNPTVPYWDSTVVAKIKAVVGLSGIYDLPLRTPQPTQQFIDDVDNYTNTTENEIDCAAKQTLASPISLSPLRLISRRFYLRHDRQFGTSAAVGKHRNCFARSGPERRRRRVHDER